MCFWNTIWIRCPLCSLHPQCYWEFQYIGLLIHRLKGWEVGWGDQFVQPLILRLMYYYFKRAMTFLKIKNSFSGFLFWIFIIQNPNSTCNSKFHGYYLLLYFSGSWYFMSDYPFWIFWNMKLPPNKSYLIIRFKFKLPSHKWQFILGGKITPVQEPLLYYIPPPGPVMVQIKD